MNSNERESVPLYTGTPLEMRVGRGSMSWLVPLSSDLELRGLDKAYTLMFCRMCIWDASAQDTLSAAKWMSNFTGLGFLPRSSVSMAGIRVKADERVVRPNTSSLIAPMAILVSE